MRERTSSGSAASDAAVRPTRSQKSTVTTLRSSWTAAAGCSVSGAEQYPQNWNPSGFSLLQAGQIVTRESLGSPGQPNQSARPYLRSLFDLSASIRAGSCPYEPT
jgi:hypothetical protein